MTSYHRKTINKTYGKWWILLCRGGFTQR